MSAKKPDISQLRKYLEGELDARAMHQLERQAQDDPFLMDAMEGYEESGFNQQTFDDLDTRLQQRIDKAKQRRIIPWKYISAAASIIVILCIAYLLWPGTQPPQRQKDRLAKTIQPPADHVVVKTDTISQPIAQKPLLANNIPVTARKKAMPQITQAPPAGASVVQPDADQTIKIDEPVGNSDVKEVTTYNQVLAKVMQHPKDSDNTKLKEVIIAGRGALVKNTVGTTPPAPQQLKGFVDGAKVDPEPSHTISGTVRDAQGLPLSGALILVNGTNLKTQTDASGRFRLATPTVSNTLAINSVGFESQQVHTDNDAANLNISLKPATSALNEVVVTGFSVVKPIKQAHPLMGWDAYNKYLKSKATATDNRTGTVQLSFTVDDKGALSNFKVLKGLNDATNQLAIDIVKNGPKWAPDASGKPKTIKLKLRFVKP